MPEYYGQQKKRTSEFFHLPEEEEIRHVHGKPYMLPAHVKSSLGSIEDRLKSNAELTKKELNDYFHYLDHLSSEVRDILQMEKAEAISNMDLEREFRKIGQLINQVSAILDRY
jgi:hypothetical protein